MSRILKLKQWLTIAEAARHLTETLSEPVTEADIFRLSLDGALTLSVYFVSSVWCKFGRSIPIADAKNKVSGILFKGMEPYELILGVRVDDGKKVLEFDDQIRMVADSVFDLPMIGGERISCEKRYHQLVNVVDEWATNIDGTFLRLPDTDHYLQICESFMPKPKNGDARSAWERHDELVWFPVGTLPGNAAFVVRVNSLTKLLASLSASDSSEKPLANRERETLLIIIAALCKDTGYDCTKAAKTAGLIQSTAAQMGVSIGETTIEGHLKKIPDALADRMK